MTLSTVILMLPGGGVVTKHAKEVSFQLVSMNKSFVSKPMHTVTTSSVGNPFNRVDFNLERHAYLEGVVFPFWTNSALVVPARHGLFLPMPAFSLSTISIK